MLLFQDEWCFCPLCNDEIKRVAEAKPEGGEEAEYWRYKRAELISMYALLTAPIKKARTDLQQPRAYEAVAPSAQPGTVNVGTPTARLSSGETCGLLAKQPSLVLLRVAFGVFLWCVLLPDRVRLPFGQVGARSRARAARGLSAAHAPRRDLRQLTSRPRGKQHSSS
jgi:hypothetical protein